LNSAYKEVSVNSASEAEYKLSEVFAKHQLFVKNTASVNLRFACASLHDGLSINFFSYGNDVEVHPDCTKEFYLAQVPLRGTGIMCSPREDIEIRPGTIGFQNPGSIKKNIWSKDCDRLVVRIPRENLERKASRLMGCPLSSRLNFSNLSPLQAPHAKSWFQLVKMVARFIKEADGQTPNDQILKTYSETIQEALLLSFENNYSEALNRKDTAILPKHIKKATDFINENYRDLITLNGLADETGCSTRSLNDGFRKFTGKTPKQYLNQVRLNAVREQLLNADNGETVTSIALANGFTQLGRFSALYKTTFGELPSETRRRYI